MNKKQQKIAVFDIDGTLFRWQLFHELVSELTLAKIFPAERYRLVDDAWQRWQGRELSFREYETLVIKTLIDFLPQIKVSTLETTAKKVVEQSGHKVYYYTRQLLKQLQADGYYTLAISGSQQELLDLFAVRYHFDDWIGSKYERRDGHYTGVIERFVPGRKADILTEYLTSHPELTLNGSVAIGDTDGDITLLEMVDRPVAFNPSEGLLKAAHAHGWPVVIERKNISYSLELRDGNFVLAETTIY